MEKGADPWLKGVNNSTVLHICGERNFVEIAKFILEFNPEQNKKLVLEKTDDDDDEEGGQTCLHISCEWDSLELVELFWQYGGEELVRIKN